MGKIKLQKIVDKLRKLHEWNGHLEIQIIIDKLQKLYEWNGHLEINPLGNFCFSEQIFHRDSHWVPPTISLTDAVLFQY